ncbi:MAG: hypothetical protein MUF14_02945 [Hyphomonadaceae bacterium]|nr:hypothetical protein [Hyphomonadaceae bacterium]
MPARLQFLSGAAVALALLLAGCTTTDSRVAANLVERPTSGSRLVVIKPEIELSLLGASGVRERRADWSEQAGSHLVTALSALVAAKGYQAGEVDPSSMMDGRVGQVLRLHDRVADALYTHHYVPGQALPSKGREFDWTLGEGALLLSPDGRGGYALFMGGGGCWSSAGRVAVRVVAFIVTQGGDVGGCSQQLYASLVRLETGQVVWFNLATAGPADDMRTAEGASSLVAAVFKDAPF